MWINTGNCARAATSHTGSRRSSSHRTRAPDPFADVEANILPHL